MRAVSLSNKTVQDKVIASFIPLKVAILPGTKKFPFDWPAMQQWRNVYRRMGNEKCQGITACTVITPDLQAQYGNTGSAFVWEMFDSIAYDAKKFAAMLDRAAKRWEREKAILADTNRPPKNANGNWPASAAKSPGNWVGRADFVCHQGDSQLKERSSFFGFLET